MVSRTFPLPECVRVLGQAIQVAYYDMRGTIIYNHNEKVRQEVEEESDLILDLTRGHPAIECAECGEEVGRGFIRDHRRGGLRVCKESRINFSDDD